MGTARHLGCAMTTLAILLTAACASEKAPTSPTPSPADPVTANAYILPGAMGLGARAFGDEPVVIHCTIHPQMEGTLIVRQ